jgi:hypothetical protein
VKEGEGRGRRKSIKRRREILEREEEMSPLSSLTFEILVVDLMVIMKSVEEEHEAKKHYNGKITVELI